jgi:hypothetical protein
VRFEQDARRNKLTSNHAAQVKIYQNGTFTSKWEILFPPANAQLTGLSLSEFCRKFERVADLIQSFKLVRIACALDISGDLRGAGGA